LLLSASSYSDHHIPAHLEPGHQLWVWLQRPPQRARDALHGHVVKSGPHPPRCQHHVHLRARGMRCRWGCAGDRGVWGGLRSLRAVSVSSTRGRRPPAVGPLRWGGPQASLDHSQPRHWVQAAACGGWLLLERGKRCLSSREGSSTGCKHWGQATRRCCLNPWGAAPPHPRPQPTSALGASNTALPSQPLGGHAPSPATAATLACTKATSATVQPRAFSPLGGPRYYLRTPRRLPRHCGHACSPA